MTAVYGVCVVCAAVRSVNVDGRMREHQRVSPTNKRKRLGSCAGAGMIPARPAPSPYKTSEETRDD